MIEFKVVRWKNFLSTGNYFTEVFLDRRSTTLIVGENGAGKSTILDALTFSLFGKSYRNINKPQLINSINEKDCLVEIEFKIGQFQYLVRRGIKPNIFEIYKNGNLINQDSKNTDYQTTLEKSILKLNYKSFTQIVILGSSSFIPFMQLKASDRRTIIEDLLDIQIFSNMNVILKQRLNNIKNELKDFDYELHINSEKKEIKVNFLEKIKSRNKELLITLEQDFNTLKSESHELKHKIDDVTLTKNNIESVLDKINDFRNKINKYENVKYELENKKKNINKNIKFYQKNSNCPTCEQEINLEFKTKKVDSGNSELEVTENALTDIKIIIDDLNQSLNDFLKVEKEIQRYETEIIKYNEQLSSVERQMSKIKLDIKKIMEDNSDKDELESDIQVLSENIKILNDKMEKTSDLKNTCETAYELLKDTGIKSQIIKQYLPIINKVLNKYLESFDFFVNFTLDENFNETIKSRHRDIFSYTSFSEGEKLRIDLALLFTWRSIAKLKNSVNTNLLILDEVFDSSLDSTGTDDFMKILNTITEFNNIFVISHKGDIIQDKFQSIIKFEKVKNFSKIA